MTSEKLMRAAGQGIAFIIVGGVAVVVLILVVAFVLLVFGWAFDG